jgi:DNA (cytosine-5)-methyltransferase 1
MLNGLDLFSGIGGLSLALSEWARPIAYCEIDRYAQAVLLSQMQDGSLPRAPIWDDVRTLSFKEDFAEIDIIYGGFPCQNISCAGNGVGLGGERSSLFFEIMRLAQEIRPKFIFLENVQAIRTRGLNWVCEELASAGYDSRWDFVSAEEVGAPHRRQRWFLLAHSNRSDIRKQSGRRYGTDWKSPPIIKPNGEFMAHAAGIGRDEWRPEPNAQRQAKPSESGCELAESSSKRLEGWLDTEAAWSALRFSGSGSGSPWPQGIPKPAICRDDDGFQDRVDKLKCCGNGVVPKQAKEAFERLSGLKSDNAKSEN